MGTQENESRSTDGEATCTAAAVGSDRDYEETARSIGRSYPPKWRGALVSGALALGFGAVAWIGISDALLEGWFVLGLVYLSPASLALLFGAVLAGVLFVSFLALVWRAWKQESKEWARQNKVIAAETRLPGFGFYYRKWNLALSQGLDNQAANARAREALTGWWRQPGNPIEQARAITASLALYQHRRRLAWSLTAGSLLLVAVAASLVWSRSTGTNMKLDAGYDVWGVAFSPDGKTLASARSDAPLKLWNVADGSVLTTMDAGSSQAASVAFSPDGMRLASGHLDGMVRLWNTSNKSLLLTLEGDPSQVTSVAFSPDGKTVASGGYDGTIKVWNVEDGSLLHTLAHESQLFEVAFSPDGSMLASAGGSVKLWNVEDGSLLRTLPGPSGGAWSVAFGPDGKTLASGGNILKLWNVADGTTIRTVNTGCPGSAQIAELSPDGKLLASGCANGAVKLWDAANGSAVRTIQGVLGNVGRPVGMAFSPDGNTLVWSGGGSGIKVRQVR